jgi:hypothetical protein
MSMRNQREFDLKGGHMQSQKVQIHSLTLVPMPMVDFILDFVDDLGIDDPEEEDGYSKSSSKVNRSNITWRERVKLSTIEEFSAIGWTAVGTLAIGVLDLKPAE